jgi:hypothetical protein
VAGRRVAEGMAYLTRLSREGQHAGVSEAKWFVGIGLAVVAIGVGLLTVNMTVGLVVILAGLVVCAAGYGRRMRAVHDARLLARRGSFFIQRDDGTHERVSYGYVTRLSHVDRIKLLSSDEKLRRWYAHQQNTENGEAATAYVEANWLKRIYLRFMAPARLRQRR